MEHPAQARLDPNLRAGDLPSERLRELMESLHLTISYDHKEHTAQIEITLTAAGQGDHQGCTFGLLRR